MSGGPVIVPWRDGTRPAAILGINAGRIRDRPGGDDIFTYAYKSTVILQCIEELRRVPAEAPEKSLWFRSVAGTL